MEADSARTTMTQQDKHYCAHCNALLRASDLSLCDNCADDVLSGFPSQANEIAELSPLTIEQQEPSIAQTQRIINERIIKAFAIPLSLLINKHVKLNRIR